MLQFQTPGFAPGSPVERHRSLLSQTVRLGGSLSLANCADINVCRRLRNLNGWITTTEVCHCPGHYGEP